MADLEKIPPHNIEAEAALLGSLLIDKDAIVRVADIVKADDFYRDAHKRIFEAIVEIYEKREPIDILSLSSRLKEKQRLEEIGGRAYLAELTNTVPTATNVVHYANIVQKKATLRRLIQAGGQIAEMGYEEPESLEEILDRSESKLFAVSQKYLKQQFIPLSSILSEAFERIDELHQEKGKLRGLSTGFLDLDNILAGLQKSDLVILASRPAVGKTSLALSVARHAAVNLKSKVGVFSLEMSKEQLADRLISAEAGVDMWKMRTGRLSSDGEQDDFTKIGHALGVLSEAPLFIDDSATANIMEIRTKARRLQSEHGLDMMIVDYLQLMEGRNLENRVQEVSEITRALKSIARELNVPVLAISQLSRAVEMRSPAIPKLADLRESGCLTGDTLIMRADTGELVPIKNLVGETNIPVFSLNENWKLEAQKITKVFSSGIKQIFGLQTRSGRTIKASANHPFLTINGWQRLDTLNTGIHIAIPRYLKSTLNIPSTLLDDEIILLAHLIGDGCVLPRQPIHYTSADKKNLQIVSEVAKRLFGITPRIVQQENWFHIYLPSPYHLTHNRHHPIVNWFQKLGLASVRSYEKVLPEILFRSSETQIRLFLHHLWSTDGNVSWKYLPQRKPAAAIYYATTSSVLSEQIQHLLLRLGILSTLRTVKQKLHRPMYQVHIQGSEQQLRFCYLIGSYGTRGELIPQIIQALEEINPNPNLDSIPKEAWRVFIEPEKLGAGLSWRDLSEKIETSYCGSTLFKTGLSRERMERVAVALESSAIFSIAQSDIYWDEVVSITPLGIEEVFDATVTATHNFVANDFIVHNSIEQDADVVMFIYRKTMDRSVKECPPEERNTADIYIAKHRNGPTGQVRLYFDEARVTFRNLEKTNVASTPL